MHNRTIEGIAFDFEDDNAYALFVEKKMKRHLNLEALAQEAKESKITEDMIARACVTPKVMKLKQYQGSVQNEKPRPQQNQQNRKPDARYTWTPDGDRKKCSRCRRDHQPMLDGRGEGDFEILEGKAMSDLAAAFYRMEKKEDAAKAMVFESRGNALEITGMGEKTLAQGLYAVFVCSVCKRAMRNNGDGRRLEGYYDRAGAKKLLLQLSAKKHEVSFEEDARAEMQALKAASKTAPAEAVVTAPIAPVEPVQVKPEPVVHVEAPAKAETPLSPQPVVEKKPKTRKAVAPKAEKPVKLKKEVRLNQLSDLDQLLVSKSKGGSSAVKIEPKPAEKPAEETKS